MEIPKELGHVKQVFTPTQGLPDDNNHDPSNIIYYRGKYYLWYTQHINGLPYDGFLNCKIMCKTSKDGYNWSEGSDALLASSSGWDDGGVLTANILLWQGRYYLCYTGVSKQFSVFSEINPICNLESAQTVEHAALIKYGVSCGLAVADTPDGPWERLPQNPLAVPSGHGWDAHCADDITIIPRDDGFYMYYKGMYRGQDGNDSQVGYAFSKTLAGPYMRMCDEPLVRGHAFALWPYKQGWLYLGGVMDKQGEGRVYNDHPTWENYEGSQSLFWSQDGLHFVPCASIANRAAGIYVGDQSDLTKCWGVTVKTQDTYKGRYIERFDFVCE